MSTADVDTAHVETAPDPAPGASLRDDLVGMLRWPVTWVVVLTGVVCRVLVIGSGFGELKADEAYTGLQSTAVLDGRFPVVIDGNAYTAVIEAYLFAPFTPIFGGSVVALKTTFVMVWAAAAVLAFCAARELYDRRTGALASAFVWLAPGGLMVLSTRAYVGYPIGLCAVFGTLWAAAHLMGRGEPTPRRSFVVGLVAGFGFYVHPMFVTVLVPVVVVVAVVHIRQLRTWWVPAVGGALLANAVFIAWNIANGFPSLNDEPVGETTYTERLGGYFTDLLPRGFGLHTAGGERYITGDGSRVFPLPIHLVIVVALLAALFAGAVVLVRRRGAGVAALVLTPLTIGWFLMAAIASLSFTIDGRYAVIQLPFIVVLLAAGAIAAVDAIAGRVRSADAVARFGPIVVGAVWVAVLFLPWWWEATGGSFDDPNDDYAAVLEVFEDEGIEYVAGAYWRVLDLEYLSDRAVRAAVIGHPPVIRFPATQRLVESQSPADVAFVFELWADDDFRLFGPIESYERRVIRDMVVYLPRP